MTVASKLLFKDWTPAIGCERHRVLHVTIGTVAVKYCESREHLKVLMVTFKYAAQTRCFKLIAAESAAEVHVRS